MRNSGFCIKLRLSVLSVLWFFHSETGGNRPKKLWNGIKGVSNDHRSMGGGGQRWMLQWKCRIQARSKWIQVCSDAGNTIIYRPLCERNQFNSNWVISIYKGLPITVQAVFLGSLMSSLFLQIGSWLYAAILQLSSFCVYSFFFNFIL